MIHSHSPFQGHAVGERMDKGFYIKHQKCILLSILNDHEMHQQIISLPNEKIE